MKPHDVCALAAAVAVLLVASGATAQQAPVEDETPPASEAATPPPATGSVHLVVFDASSAPVTGASVVLPGGTSMETDEDGSVWLSLPAGEHALQLTQSVDAPPVPLGPLVVVAGETTEAIVTFAADGTLATTDIMAPDAEAKARSEAAAGAAGAELPRGTVRGRIFSAEDGAPIVGAKVYAAGQTAEGTSDETGVFELELPVGKHTLSVIHTKYSTQTIDAVEVVAGQVKDLSVELTPAALELEDFVVSAPHVEGGVASLLEERRDSATVSDSVGAEDIARMPASDAAQAAQRVVGATIVGGRFVFVRGLGERYSNALLNGAPLPSPEPDRATVPLDLFPAQILASLDISKTFTPDVPGDFAGGSVRIVTKEAPDEPLMAASVSAKYDSESTFQDVYGQRASSTDWLGFDDGMRDLNPGVPTDYPLILGTERPDGELVLRDELEEKSPLLNTPMSVEPGTNPPSFSGSLALGDGWPLGSDARIGVVGSLIYRRTFEKSSGYIAEYQASSAEETGLEPLKVYDRSDTAVDAVRWGAFGSTSLELSKEHELTLLGMRSQLADATTRILGGFDDNNMQHYRANHLEFTSRALTFGQLQGHHAFEDVAGAELDWLLALAVADRQEPDTRDVVFRRDSQGAASGLPEDLAWDFYPGSDSGRHFFSNQDETSRTAGVDWTQPLTDGDVATKVKAGALLTVKDRTFGARRFVFQKQTGANPDPCPDPYDPVACPDQLFTDDFDQLRVLEGTRPGDRYDANLDVYAAYLMGDVGLGEQWRLIAGARVEETHQGLTSLDQFTDEVDDDGSTSLRDTKVLPSASIVYSPMEDLNIRVATTRTLARPQLRELAPFAFADYFGGAQQSGNPDLRLTSILNGDLRVEYYPSTREVLALSLFAKDFTDPIEPVLRPSSSTSVLSYENALGATLWGVELEARKSLDFLGDALEDLTLIASLMLADSQIRTDEEYLTNTERPLVQQAPYVINASLDYETEAGTQVRLLYNVSGRKIVEVGADRLDDVYEHPEHLLDLTASQRLGDHFEVKLTLQNLLNAQYLVTVGKQDRGYNVRRSSTHGVSASVGVSYSH